MLSLEDEDMDELERDDASLQDGPYSSQIEMTMGTNAFASILNAFLSVLSDDLVFKRWHIRRR